MVFLFRHVLMKDLGDVSGALRAKRGKRIPVVLSQNEIQSILSHLDATNGLLARLLYGCGLRLQEGVSLRIKDIDFELRCVRVFGKGDKERETILPESLVSPIKAQIIRQITSTGISLAGTDVNTPSHDIIYFIADILSIQDPFL